MKFRIVILLAIAFLALADFALAIPRCNSCPYSCEMMGLGRRECSNKSNSAGVCCVDLSSEGLEFAMEFDRARGNSPQQNYPQGGQNYDRCPAGFQPSEQKCSPQERQRGCKDIRLPSGLGCVKR